MFCIDLIIMNDNNAFALQANMDNDLLWDTSLNTDMYLMVHMSTSR